MGLTRGRREECNLQAMLLSLAATELPGTGVLTWLRRTPLQVHVRMQAYGAQAVVVSIDPRRVYVADPASTQRPTIKTEHPGPNGEQYCW